MEDNEGGMGRTSEGVVVEARSQASPANEKGGDIHCLIWNFGYELEEYHRDARQLYTNTLHLMQGIMCPFIFMLLENRPKTIKNLIPPLQAYRMTPTVA